MSNKKYLIIIISLFIGAFSSYIFLDKTTNINYLENKIINISQKYSHSVVSIIEEKDLDIFEKNKYGIFNNKVGGGSGFFVNKEGIIITNNHIVKNKNSKYIVILNNGKKINSTVIYTNKDKDIAFLKILAKKEFIPLEFIQNKNNIKLGQFSIAIGNALAEFQNSVSLGIVSGINRKIEDNYNNYNNLIQTDTAINPGNSGGPLLNLDGKVMGINTMIINGSQNIGFAISLTQSELEKYLEKIKK